MRLNKLSSISFTHHLYWHSRTHISLVREWLPQRTQVSVDRRQRISIQTFPHTTPPTYLQRFLKTHYHTIDNWRRQTQRTTVSKWSATIHTRMNLESNISTTSILKSCFLLIAWKHFFSLQVFTYTDTWISMFTTDSTVIAN
jgi:hypothetical protein